MAAIMAAIRTADIWTVERTLSRLGLSSLKEEVVAEVQVTDVEHEFLVASENVSPTHVEMQRMIE